MTTESKDLLIILTIPTFFIIVGIVRIFSKKKAQKIINEIVDFFFGTKK